MFSKVRGAGLKPALTVGALGAVAIIAWGTWAREANDDALADVSREAAIPTVRLIRAAPAEAGGKLVLSAEIQAWNTADIHARTNGYVDRWLVDIGDAVREGQILAVLDAPELDLQLAQARAQHQTALADLALARATADRWSALLERDAVSRQAAEEKAGALAASAAVADAARANVQRLAALRGFTRLAAPFDGVVTSRSAEVGALVTAGVATTPLFTIADTRRMRVQVRVPQSASADIRPGMQAELRLPEAPGETFSARVTRSAQAVDGRSGTMLVELQADNPQRRLKPGSYAEVAFPVTGGGGVVIPASALILGRDGPRVASVDSSGRASLTPVRLGRDHGRTVEILDGVRPGTRLINAPPDALAEGDPVRIQQQPPQGRTHAQD
ncbi:efflux RND transporter periplasmic adaptor subunit [uncultured Brevundimonas sp.]|uniref:efflux RND transporter periplasmic adaptor subunit n=1 Tax=uncultured Brevundimonas sp. TaxID=213418 RepID=UPI00261C07DA|nr:efflux RND transporter periplasmic adaptor subunit [uncultured Brevundimonas sp.]